MPDDKKEELTQEDVFSNDIDPLDGIRALRKEEGVSEEDLPPASEDVSDTPADTSTDNDDDLKEFDDQPGDDTQNQDQDTSNDQTDDQAAQQTDQQPTGDQDNGLQATEEGQTNAEETTKKATVDSQEKLKFKANGQEFEFTPDEIVDQFGTVFGQAMDYTKKMQQIAPYRKMISAIEAEGITQEQLNLAIDALKGDKGALQQIIKEHEIETFDLEPEDGQATYQPKQYGKDEHTLAIEEVTSKIAGDSEFKITVDVIDNQWDQKSREAFANNPKLISGLHHDIKSGLFDEVSPRAMKMKVLDGNSKSDIEYYILAGEQLRLEKQETSQQTVDQVNQQTQDAVDNADQASSEAQRKRAASSTRTRADRKGVIDYMDDDDEAFDAWYANLQASN